MPFVDHAPPPPAACKDPRHDPPGLIVLPAGQHVWECPRCKHKQIIYVRTTTCGLDARRRRLAT